MTKTMFEVEGSDTKYPGAVKKEHYTVCDANGKFLFLFTPEPATKDNPHAKIIATHIYNWLVKLGLDKTICGVGGDSCNVNTGWKGGAIHYLEELLGRKLNWIVCDLHTNELPLRHLIITLDGKTLSNNRWSGPLGQMLDDAPDLSVNKKFKKIDCTPLPQLKPEVLKDLSTDQAYAYKIHEAIWTGIVSDQLANLQIGPVSHSRWLTTALRFLRIWIGKHGLKSKNLKNLEMIVEYIMGVYLPNWFNIKVNHHWTEGPRHLLFQQQLVQQQKKVVRDIVIESVQRSAWYGFSESILQSMVTSEDEEERRWALNKIISIRGEGEEKVGCLATRERKTPMINSNSNKRSH
jgi:hypothetical protein